MSPDGTLESWHASAIPAGSSRYYALLHLPPAQRQRAKNLLALTCVWARAGFSSREVEIAKQKFGWWHDELAREAFRHPLTTALQGQIGQPELAHLDRILRGYSGLLETGSPSTAESNHQFHQQTGSTTCRLLCACDHTTSEYHTAIDEVGAALSRWRCLRYLRHHVENGLLCLVLDRLKQRDLTPNLLVPGHNNPVIQEFLNDELSQLAEELAAACEKLAASGEESGAGLYVYAVMQHALLETVIKEGSKILEQDTRLTPLRLYWLARKASKHYLRSVSRREKTQKQSLKRSQESSSS